MKVITVVFLTVALLMGLPFSPFALSASVTPILIDPWSNHWEQDTASGYQHSFKIEPVVSETITYAGNTITISVYNDSNGDPTFDWTSTYPIKAVIVKGGPVANLYVYNPASYGDTNLYAPINPNNNKPYGLSHIRFCWDDSQQTLPLLNVLKFYDFNANGIFDDGEMELSNWKVRVSGDGFDEVLDTPVLGLALSAGDYTVSELMPLETCWVSSTPSSVVVSLVSGGNEVTVEFGNYCLVPSGGYTIGFWSNKNGQALWNALYNSGEITLPPDKNLAKLATAKDMSVMLKAQLTALKLNIAAGFVDGGAFYIPYGGTINDLTAEAEAALTSSDRNYQETLKNYIDQINNGALVIPPLPCPYTF